MIQKNINTADAYLDKTLENLGLEFDFSKKILHFQWKRIGINEFELDTFYDEEYVTNAITLLFWNLKRKNHVQSMSFQKLKPPNQIKIFK